MKANLNMKWNGNFHEMETCICIPIKQTSELSTMKNSKYDINYHLLLKEIRNFKQHRILSFVALFNACYCFKFYVTRGKYDINRYSSVKLLMAENFLKIRLD